MCESGGKAFVHLSVCSFMFSCTMTSSILLYFIIFTFSFYLWFRTGWKNYRIGCFCRCRWFNLFTLRLFVFILRFVIVFYSIFGLIDIFRVLDDFILLL